MRRLRRRLTGSASLRAPRNEGNDRNWAVVSVASKTRSRRPGAAASGRWARRACGDLGVGQGSAVHASASIAFSSAPRAACNRHLAVPTGIPSDRAISATGRSSTWWRTRIIRSCGRSRSKARPIASLSTNWSMRRSGVQILRRFGLWGFVARVGRTHRHLAEPDPMPARHQGGVRDDPVEPAVEDRGIAEPRQLSPGGHERVLGGIGCVGVVGRGSTRRGGSSGRSGYRRGPRRPPRRRCERAERARRRPTSPRSLPSSPHPHRPRLVDRSARLVVRSPVDRSCRVSRCRRGGGGWVAREIGPPPNPGRADGIYRAPHLRSPEER